jgi:arylsulfatase A-like enzyme
MVDEERYPPCYETDAVNLFRKKNLKAQEAMRQQGIEFHRHYAAATACSPSRASFFTGQYPSLHGVTQTPGAAKGPFDPDVFWLDASSVPTMGDYFRATGYRTFYRHQEKDVRSPAFRRQA